MMPVAKLSDVAGNVLTIIFHPTLHLLPWGVHARILIATPCGHINTQQVLRGGACGSGIVSSNFSTQEFFNGLNVRIDVFQGFGLGRAISVNDSLDATHHHVSEVEPSDELYYLPLSDVCHHCFFDPCIQNLYWQVPPDMCVDPAQCSSVVIYSLQWLDQT